MSLYFMNNNKVRFKLCFENPYDLSDLTEDVAKSTYKTQLLDDLKQRGGMNLIDNYLAHGITDELTVGSLSKGGSQLVLVHPSGLEFDCIPTRGRYFGLSLIYDLSASSFFEINFQVTPEFSIKDFENAKTLDDLYRKAVISYDDDCSRYYIFENTQFSPPINATTYPDDSFMMINDKIGLGITLKAISLNLYKELLDYSLVNAYTDDLTDYFKIPKPADQRLLTKVATLGGTAVATKVEGRYLLNFIRK